MSGFTKRIRHPRGVPGILQSLKLGALALVAALAAACGGDDASLAGGNGPAPAACADCGTALLTITDAPGDFQSYTIDVTSLELVKANGTVVQTLPAATRIDFAELVDLGEVLSAGQVPAAVYVAAKLRVDYTDAQIVVEDAAGGSMTVAPVDAAGQPLGSVELTVQLDERNRLRINPRRVSHLSFDLNLEASNTVDLVAGKVTVSPFIVASIEPPGERDWRSRGRLLDVDVAGSSYTVQVRPFHHHEHSMGEMKVQTTADTSFEIDGVSSSGAAGLAQLATLADGTMVVAFGTLDTTDFSFTAQRVLAGNSVDDLRHDFMSGNVLSRSGDTLVVGGVRLYWTPAEGGAGHDRHYGRFLHLPVTLQVGPGTRVTRAGQRDGTLDAGIISVGQRIQVIGDLSRDGMGGIVMDATAGLVRLNYTRLAGVVTASEPGKLTVDLAAIHGLRPARFDFAGTGSMAALDADPDAYEVAVRAGLDTGMVTVGSWTRLFGFVTPFGMAPPDFTAATLVDHSGMRAAAEVLWLPGGSTAPFSALSASGLTVDPAAMPNPVGGVRLGAAVVRLGEIPGGLTLVPADGSARRYAIAHRPSGRIENFSDFGEFVAALDAALDGDANLYRLHAYGTFDALAGRFAARQLLVMLGP